MTPAIVVEILKSSWVICRAQPPSWIRFGNQIEGTPELRHTVHVGCGQVEQVRLVARETLVLRSRVGKSFRIFDVDGALGRFIGISNSLRALPSLPMQLR